MVKDQEDQAATSLSIVAAAKEIGMEEKNKAHVMDIYLKTFPIISFKIRGYKLAGVLKKCT